MSGYLCSILKAFSSKVFFVLLISELFPYRVHAQQTAKYTYQNNLPPVGYLEYLPPDYSTSEGKFPLLIFLHGGGEGGNGTPELLERLKTWGPPHYVNKGHDMCFSVNDEQQCFIVLSPQLDINVHTWLSMLSQLIDHILDGPDQYKVDLSRIYLTGMSYGGFGVYAYAGNELSSANILAAVAPIAAWSDDSGEGCIISRRKIAVWAFHGALDPVIPHPWGLAAFDNVRYCSNPAPEAEMIFTTYPDRYHDSWIPAYDTGHFYHSPNLYEWLLRHKRPDPVTRLTDDIKGVYPEFSIHPNPAQDHIFLSFGENPATPATISILSIRGELIMEVVDTSHPIDISPLPAGVYVVQVSTDSETFARSRLIKLK